MKSVLDLDDHHAKLMRDYLVRANATVRYRRAVGGDSRFFATLVLPAAGERLRSVIEIPASRGGLGGARRVVNGTSREQVMYCTER